MHWISFYSAILNSSGLYELTSGCVVMEAYLLSFEMNGIFSSSSTDLANNKFIIYGVRVATS